ncbi:MAG: dihydroneopterin aldolase [Odoribacter sp.]|nr:dihydroneopterin aldolase [Odoribacter sp.]
MTGIIEIEKMEFFAYHGCFEAEQIVGNRFEVYTRLEYDCTAAAHSDDINDALSYQTAYEIIAREMMKPSHLLEHVGTRILDALYAAFPQLQYARIKICKMNPPLGGQIGCTAVTLEKSV